MGTSQSSGGPGPGVPMVPPWTPPSPPPDESPNPQPPDNPQNLPPEGEGNMPSPVPAPVQPAPLAPPGRFMGVRRGLGDYVRSGDRGDLGRSLGHYVRSGYGGSQTATRRFGGTATTAGTLAMALANVASGQTTGPGVLLDRALLEGRSADEVIEAVVEAVRPVDGTQDAEAQRAAICDALSELLTRFPDADLLNLDAGQRAFAIERFAAMDVVRRFELDVGKTILEKAPSATTALSRLKEVREYIKESVSAAFRRLRSAGQNVTTGRVSRIVSDALRETFEVFEGYAQ